MGSFKLSTYDLSPDERGPSHIISTTECPWIVFIWNGVLICSLVVFVVKSGPLDHPLFPYKVVRVLCSLEWSNDLLSGPTTGCRVWCEKICRPMDTNTSQHSLSMCNSFIRIRFCTGITIKVCVYDVMFVWSHHQYTQRCVFVCEYMCVWQRFAMKSNCYVMNLRGSE